MIYKCLIADDEPIARQIIERYVKDVPDLKLSGSCKNAFEVMEVLRLQEIDILFLDINMPKLSGISLLKTLKSYPNVIITTAYGEFALEGYDLDVVDYLMKPISFERFIQAVNKIRKTQEPYVTSEGSDEKATSYFFVKSDRKQVRINFTDIRYVEAFGNYVKIYADEMILSPNTLTETITKLPEKSFVRIHKSFVVNKDQIKQIEGNQITLLNGDRLNIGKAFKKNIAQWINTQN